MLLKRDLDLAMQTLLATATGCLIGMLTAPIDTTLPYAILFPQGGPVGEGSWHDPEEDRGWNYQYTSVGSTALQVSWMSDKIRAYLLEPTTFPLAVTGGWIQNVSSVHLGAILTGGENIWQAQDVYRVKAGK